MDFKKSSYARIDFEESDETLIRLALLLVLSLVSTLGLTEAKTFTPMPSSAPNNCCGESSLCLKKVQNVRSMITTGAKPLLRLGSGKFCTTPYPVATGLIMACNNGIIYFLSKTGAILTKPAPIKMKIPDNGLSGEIHLEPIPDSQPQSFLAVVAASGEIVRVEQDGKMIAVAKFEDTLFEPRFISSEVVLIPYGYSDEARLVNLKTGEQKEVKVPTNNSGFDVPVRLQTSEKKQLVFSTKTGAVVVMNDDGTQISIQVSESALSRPSLAPDNKIWVTDAKGKLYVVDPNDKNVQEFSNDLHELNSVGILDKRASPIIFLKDGTYALEYANNLYFYGIDHKLKSYFDFKATKSLLLSNEYKKDPSLYLAKVMAPIARVDLADGNESIFVPTHGGFYLVSESGLQGIYSVPQEGERQAEFYSQPRMIKAGEFYLGTYYGVEKYTVKSSTTAKIATQVWSRCP